MKFALRKNLIYPFQLIIWNWLRNLEVLLINYLFNFGSSLIYSPLMFLGEFILGIFIYSYQMNFLKVKKSPSARFMSIKLIETDNEMNIHDSQIKICFLLFIASFLDYVGFMIASVFIPKFINISQSIVFRLSCILTITDALLYYYILKLPILRHQFFSLIITSICLIIVIITEYFFQDFNSTLSLKDFSIVLLLNILCEVFGALIDVIEKYLFEYNFFNPFLALGLEGMFGFVLSFLCFIFPNYGKDIIKVYNNNSIGNNFLFTFLLSLYIILSGSKNTFRVVTTKLYSPMARGLTDYFLNPFYLTLSFIIKIDFFTKGEQNILYFLINLILSIIISFCGCVFNEFIILFFCNLEHDTHHQIVQRSDMDNLTDIDSSSDADIKSEKKGIEKELLIIDSHIAQ